MFKRPERPVSLASVELHLIKISFVMAILADRRFGSDVFWFFTVTGGAWFILQHTNMF
jgi:hypothetical protein